MTRSYPKAIMSAVTIGLVIMTSNVMAGGGGCTSCTWAAGDFDGRCCDAGCCRTGCCDTRCGCGGDNFDTGGPNGRDRSGRVGQTRGAGAARGRLRGALSALTSVPAGDCRCGATSDNCLPNYCGLQAPQYAVPYATPQHVSWHYFTYPPMMPHHSLPHYRHTYAYKHGPGLSRTTVNWTTRPIEDAANYLHHLVSLPTPR